MPVVVWGNGGCIGIGTIMMPFLAQLASQGIVVIANGSPGNVTATFESFETAPRTTAKALTDAIDWAVANAGKGSYGHMDASRLAAAGQSCGGLEAMTVSSDPRVSAVGVFNSGSGLIGGKTNLTGVSKPFFFVLGGPTDMAYQYVCTAEIERTSPLLTLHARARLTITTSRPMYPLGKVTCLLDTEVRITK